jgi:large subunit ribosomal protein L17
MQYRKLGRTSPQRKAMIRSLVTQLLWHEKIKTTEARAKETRKEVEKLIKLAVKEKDNFEEVTVKAKVAKKDANGKRIKKEVDGKKKVEYDIVDKVVKKDKPSRLNARRKILSVLYPVKEVGDTRKKRVAVNLANKLFDEIAPKYEGRKGGYTRIIKIGERKGDASMQVLMELV